jgi:putative transcriptional regulator
MAAGEGPRHAIVTLGYSGWSPGQLEQELRDNAWLTAPASEEVLFTTPLEERWEAAANIVGVNLIQLTSYAGHA